MVAAAIYSVTMVLWKETAFPVCRAMERRCKRNVVSRVSSVILVNGDTPVISLLLLLLLCENRPMNADLTSVCQWREMRLVRTFVGRFPFGLWTSSTVDRQGSVSPPVSCRSAVYKHAHGVLSLLHN